MMKHCNPRHPSSPPSLGIGGIPMGVAFSKFSEIFRGLCQLLGCAILILLRASVTPTKCITLFF